MHVMVASYFGIKKSRSQMEIVEPVKDQSGAILDMLINEPLPDRPAVAADPAALASETAAILDSLVAGPAA